MFDDEAAVDLGRDTDDLEILIEGGIDNGPNEGDDNDENQDNTEGNQPNPEGTPQQPKKRVVKNPQPKLNPDRLRGPRGIATLEHVFKDFKFHGKGYEKHDLNKMMKQLEHWAHRLYPRFQFDDCLEKIEKLGHKKQVGTLVKRIRMGLETGDEPMVRADDDDDGGAVDNPGNLGDDTESPLDAFDALLSQQLSEAKARMQLHSPQLSQPPQLAQSPQLSQPPQPSTQVITEEQRERMLRNRQLAEERRRAKLLAQVDKPQKESEECFLNHEDSSQVINLVAEAGQQIISDAAGSLVSHQEISSQNLCVPDGDVCRPETSVQSNQDLSDCAHTTNDTVAGTENECLKPKLKEATIASNNIISARCDDKNYDLKSSKEGNDDNHVSDQSLEMDAENSFLYKEDSVRASPLRKDVDQSIAIDVNPFPLPFDIGDKNRVEMDVCDLDH